MFRVVDTGLARTPNAPLNGIPADVLVGAAHPRHREAG